MKGQAFDVGDKITVLRGLLCMNGIYDRSYNGSILEVKAFAWPYCVVHEVMSKHGFVDKRRASFSLDLREYEVMKLTDEYMNALGAAEVAP